MALLYLTWQPQNQNQNQNQQQQQRRWRTSPPLGLKNLGNTCYLNSVLQCLTYTPPLAQFCLQSHHSPICKSLFPNRECPFCIVERQITRSLTWEISPVDSPGKMVKCVNLFAENFRPCRQEDAHEFLRYVIDKCHNSCLKLVKKAAATSLSPPGPATSSTVLKEIFGGVLLSQVKCLSCKGESNKMDEMMDISLDLYSSNSLKDALGKFFQPELLEGNNKYNCSKCKNLSAARKQMFVLRAPNVLVIQLKRFEGIHGGKINRNIEFEEVLLLSKFMYNTSPDLQPAYNLFGSIVHSGFSPDSGHYYAYIKDPSGRWYCCNDAQVTLSSTQEVLSEKVYILFYLRNNPSPISGKLGSPCNALASDSNLNEVSSHQKSAELLKAPIIRTNGVTSKNIVPTVLKNGKISANPHIKPFNIKNPEMKKAVVNGFGNLGVHSNGSAYKNGVHKLSITKKTILRDHDSLGKNRVENKLLSSSSKSTVVNGNSSHLLENGKKKLEVPNGNGCSNHLKENMHNEKAIQHLAAVNRDFDHPSNHLPSETNSVIAAPKRKLSINEGDVSSDICAKVAKGTCSSSRNDASCKIQTCHWAHSGEFEKFKAVIASEASSELGSCGWVDEVHNYMHARKLLCTERIGSCPDNTELRRQLIGDAKKAFLSQIPESLKEHLVKRLRSFSQEKPSSDA